MKNHKQKTQRLRKWQREANPKEQRTLRETQREKERDHEFPGISSVSDGLHSLSGFLAPSIILLFCSLLTESNLCSCRHISGILVPSSSSSYFSSSSCPINHSRRLSLVKVDFLECQHSLSLSLSLTHTLIANYKKICTFNVQSTQSLTHSLSHAGCTHPSCKSPLSYLSLTHSYDHFNYLILLHATNSSTFLHNFTIYSYCALVIVPCLLLVIRHSSKIHAKSMQICEYTLNDNRRLMIDLEVLQVNSAEYYFKLLESNFLNQLDGRMMRLLENGSCRSQPNVVLNGHYFLLQLSEPTTERKACTHQTRCNFQTCNSRALQILFFSSSLFLSFFLWRSLTLRPCVSLSVLFSGSGNHSYANLFGLMCIVLFCCRSNGANFHVCQRAVQPL